MIQFIVLKVIILTIVFMIHVAIWRQYPNLVVIF